MLAEASIIHQLYTAFPEQIGDDAAVFAFTENQSYVITKDLLIEDIHFNINYCDPMSLAQKALHVNLSDIAAMGAVPQLVLLGIAIPPTYETQLPNFLEAFTTACKDTSVILIGGDTTRSTDKLCISITVIGTAKNSHLKYRKNAQVNDLICLVGPVGYAHVGFVALEASQQQGGLLTAITAREPLIRHCVTPSPWVRGEGKNQGSYLEDNIF